MGVRRFVDSPFKGPDEFDLTSGGIGKPLFCLSLPIVIMNLFQTAYNLADTFWLGRHSTDTRIRFGDDSRDVRQRRRPAVTDGVLFVRRRHGGGSRSRRRCDRCDARDGRGSAARSLIQSILIDYSRRISQLRVQSYFTIMAVGSLFDQYLFTRNGANQLRSSHSYLSIALESLLANESE